MKDKGEVFSKFQEFKALVENQTGLKIKVLRSDNGGEYIGKKFQEFCAENGIERSFSTPYAPNQNGTAERFNRTLIERVTSMMMSSGLPYYLWGEALMTANYLKNLSPHSSIENMTPEEAWSGKKPSVKHLKAFGCKASTLVTPSKTSKFGSRVWMGSFVGYGGSSFGFRIWDPIKRQVFMRKDVKFFEDEKIDYSSNKANFPDSMTHSFVVEFVDPPSEVSAINNENGSSIEEGNEGRTFHEVQRAVDLSTTEEEQPELRRSTRIRRPVQPYQRFGQLHQSVCVEDVHEPQSLREAMEGGNSKLWEKAISEEIQSLEENKTWRLVIESGKFALLLE
jgi:hypothetical protein